GEERAEAGGAALRARRRRRTARPQLRLAEDDHAGGWQPEAAGDLAGDELDEVAVVLLLGDEQEALAAGASGVHLARQARQLAVEDVGGSAAEVDRRAAWRDARRLPGLGTDAQRRGLDDPRDLHGRHQQLVGRRGELAVRAAQLVVLFEPPREE